MCPCVITSEYYLYFFVWSHLALIMLKFKDLFVECLSLVESRHWAGCSSRLTAAWNTKGHLKWEIVKCFFSLNIQIGYQSSLWKYFDYSWGLKILNMNFTGSCLNNFSYKDAKYRQCLKSVTWAHACVCVCVCIYIYIYIICIHTLICIWG